MKENKSTVAVKAALEDFFLAQEVKKNKPCAVAVSGGRDSIALLHALESIGLEYLEVLHFNHGLRGLESDADADFVRRYCQRKKLPLRLVSGDLTQRTQGLETAARNARYSFFQQMQQEYGYQGVFLAHHADDQAETVLYNLCRGGAGLRGMHPVKKRGTLHLWRPLLNTRRSTLTNYIKENALQFREDPTNQEAITARNRIRNEVFPLLNDILKRETVPSIVRGTSLAQEEEAFLQDQSQLADFLDPQGRLFLPKLQKANPILQRRLLKNYLENQKVSALNHSLITEAMSLLEDQTKAKINLPEGHYFRRKQKRLFVIKKENEAKEKQKED